MQLAHSGAALMAARMELVEQLSEHVVSAYANLAPNSRPAAIAYTPRLAASAPLPTEPELLEALLLTEMAQRRRAEVERGAALVGPHRDDVELILGQEPAKGFASHGETWSFALALRLGAYGLLRSEGPDPILILDDVFAELDRQRREALMGIVAQAEQVLITSAVGEELPQALMTDDAVSHYVVGVRGSDSGRVSELVTP